MSYFKRARKYNKPSVTLDEKIAKAYKEFEKTGVLLEGPANRTSGLYYADKEIPEVPAVMDNVPDSTGFFGGGTQDVNGGDVNDPNTWDVGWNTVLDMENASVLSGLAGRPIALTPEELSGWNGTSTGANDLNFSSWGNGGKAHGIAWFPGAHGQLCIGTLTSDNRFVQILVGDAVFGGYAYPYDQRSWMEGGYYGGYSASEFAAAQAVARAYEANKNNGNHIGRACWAPFGSVTQQSYASYSGAKKGTNDVTPSYPDGYPRQWALRNLTILGGPNEYEKEAKVPGYTQIVFQDELGKGENLNMSGFQKLLSKLFEISTSAVDYLAKQPLNKLLTATGYFEGSKDSNFKKAKDVVQNILPPQLEWATEIGVSLLFNKPVIRTENDVSTRDVNQLLNNIPKSQFTISNTEAVVADGNVFFNKKTGKIESNHIDSSLPDIEGEGGRQHSSNLKHKDMSGDIGKNSTAKLAGVEFSTFGYADAMANEGAGQVQVVTPDDGSEPYALISNFSYFNMKDEAGEDKTGLGNLLHKALGKDINEPNTGEMSGIGSNIKTMKFTNVKVPLSKFPSSFLNKVKEKQKEEQFANINQDYEPRGQVLTEKNHLRARREAKRALAEKKVGGRISKVNLPGPKDHLTVKAIDMLRQYKVNEKEMQEYATIIGEINQWIRDNPKEYEIWKVRYPANDPRLAELNWRLDQQLKASEEYVDSRFPENEKLYKKLKKKIKSNIDATNPKRFEKEKSEVVYTKLLKVSKAIKLDTIAPL